MLVHDLLYISFTRPQAYMVENPLPCVRIKQYAISDMPEQTALMYFLHIAAIYCQYSV